jgi:hypothetical protein
MGVKLVTCVSAYTGGYTAKGIDPKQTSVTRMCTVSECFGQSKCTYIWGLPLGIADLKFQLLAEVRTCIGKVFLLAKLVKSFFCSFPISDKIRRWYQSTEHENGVWACPARCWNCELFSCWQILVTLRADWKYKQFRATCTKEVHLANAFGMASSNSSATKCYARASVAFLLAGIISLSVDSM